MKRVIEKTTKTALMLFAICFAGGAWADSAMTNPVTGETETYENVFTGAGATATEWNSADNWTLKESGKVPFVSGGNYAPALVDGETASTSTAIDGWTLRVGAYNGASVTWSGGIGKIQAGSSGCWLTADETSSITIASFGGNQLEGSDSAPFKLSSANAGGITWSAGLTAAGNTSLPFWYYLKGAGTVVYGGDITVANAQVIKQADIKLSGTSQVASKTLVTFGSGTTKTFTADATIKIKNGDGDDVLKTVYLTSITSGSTTLTGEEAVGTCQLVQTNTGIVLYWVDGSAESVTGYKRSININFTNGSVLTTPADVGLAGYAVPGKVWNNFTIPNDANTQTFDTVNSIDSTGAASVASGVSVTVSGHRGRHQCSSLDSASNPLHGYIDEGAQKTTPTVTITGIPYEHYRVIVYHSTDTADKQFGYDTINGFNFTYVDGVQTEGTTSWGSAGASNSAEPIGEGTNTLVSAVLSGDTVTMVAHRIENPLARGCFAAIQVVEYVPEVGENDLEIAVDGATDYPVDAAKNLSGTVYLTGSGTLTLSGSEKITAATIDVGSDVILNINADRLDATTFTGAGTVVYDGVAPVAGKGWAAIGWSGTVWIKNYAIGGLNPGDFANASSTLRLSVCTGYFNDGNNTKTCAGTLDLQNDTGAYAFAVDNGWSTEGKTIFAKLTGSGTLGVQTKDIAQRYIFKDASGFTGTINLAGRPLRVIFGDGESLAPAEGTITVASGATVTVPSGKTWTANKNGFVVNGTLNVAGTLSSNAASAVSGSGTVVFGGVPSPTGDAWWKNDAWTGTVQVNGYSSMAGNIPFNSCGNAGSIVELKNVTGWINNNFTCTPKLKVTGTLYLNNGSSGKASAFKVGTLLGDGTIYGGDSADKVVFNVTNNWSGFTGTIGLNNKCVVFGSTIPDSLTAGTIYVSSGAVVTPQQSSGVWWAVGGIKVDGELRAPNLDKFGGGTTITTSDDGVFTLTDSSNTNDSNTDYARITGTGTLRYAEVSDKWRTLSKVNFPTNMVCENNLTTGLILETPGYLYTIGSLSGSGAIRSDMSDGNRDLRILQAKDTTYSGVFHSTDRIGTVTVAPGTSTAGTLTLSGPQTVSNDLVVEAGASVNLTGAWSGATTVAGTGTFACSGTLTGNLTAQSGSTLDFSGATSEARISGAVTLASGTTIKLPAGADLSAGYQIATSGGTGVIDATVQIKNGATITENLKFENGTIYEITPVEIDEEDKTYTVSEVFGEPTSTSDYVLDVTATATLTVPETTVRTVKYNFTADGNTITLAGGHKIPATTTNLKIADAASLTAGNYTLLQWTTPQKCSTGYGQFSSVDVSGLPSGLAAEIVYGVKAIYLRVYNIAEQSAKGTIKIWPYGDSITEGYNAGGTKANYRVLLAQKLSLLGYNVEMVGCYDKVNGADAVDPSGRVVPDAWKWHSAKHGATAGPTTSAVGRANLCENVDTLSAQVGNPDVVLLLVGANDIVPATGLSAQQVVESIKYVVAHLAANLPNSKIVVGNQLGIEEGYTPGNYSHVTSMISQVNTLLAEYFSDLPEGYENRVFLADLNSYVKSGEYGILFDHSSDHLHPDWWGHDQMAEGWLSVITNQFTASQVFPSATPIVAPTTEQLGAANKSELDAYRAGFKRYGVINIPDGATNLNPATYAYSDVDETATVSGIARVGYFVEYVRADNNVHKWVWVDMDAFDSTIAGLGLPSANHQVVVNNLHVKSNHNGIYDVAADDSSVQGFVEFSPYSYSGGVSSVSGAPAGNGSSCDWNDTLGSSGSYSCMQVHRISPNRAADGLTRGGQVLFAFNNWHGFDSNPPEFGIGNFSQHFYTTSSEACTLDYTFTRTFSKMNADAYTVKSIEIWTKPEYTATIDADANFSTVKTSAELPVDASACDLVINVTDDSTLTFDESVSVGSIRYIIAENKTLTLDGVSNLTVGKVIVAGPGKLLVNENITMPALNAADGAVIEVAEGKKLTVTGALVVLPGATLTLEVATPNVSGNYTLISAGSIYNGDAITIDVSSTESLDMQTSIVGGDVIMSAIPVQKFTYTAIHSDPAQTPSGWFNSWSWDGFSTYMRVGPNAGTNMVYEVSANEHPGSALEKDSSFTLSLYADVSKMASDGTTRAVMFAYGGGKDNGNKFLVMYRQGDDVKLANWNNGDFTGYWAASVPVATGYHLWTASFNASTGTMTLYRDGGTDSGCKSSGTPAASFALATSGNNGLQIGTVWGNCPTTGNFAVGKGMALVGVYGYDVALSDTDVQNIAANYPATDPTVIPGKIDMSSYRTLTVYSSTYNPALDGNNYFGVTHGTVTIPVDNTVNVTYLKCLNTSWGQNSATLNVEGTLNITTTSSAETTPYYDGGKGILLGHWGGTGTYNITGSLIGRNACLETAFSASTQTINVNGGLLAVRDIFQPTTKNVSTINLSNNGTFELAKFRTDGNPIALNFGYGKFKVADLAADALTAPWAINFTGTSSQPTTLDPNGHTLVMSAGALTGNGYIKVASSVDEGEKGSVTFAGSAAGFTGTVVIDDTSKNLITFTDITDYYGDILYTGTGTLPSYLSGFTGTLTITGSSVDATGINLSGATVVLSSGATVSVLAGQERFVTVESGATLNLYVGEDAYSYEGHVFQGTNNSGTIHYYHPNNEDGYDLVSDAGALSGNNLLPYYQIWEVSGGTGSGNVNVDANWKGGKVPGTQTGREGEYGNAAFHVTGGSEITVTIDATIPFGEIQVYGTGTVTFVPSGVNYLSANILDIASGVTVKVSGDKPLRISDGYICGSGALEILAGAVMELNDVECTVAVAERGALVLSGDLVEMKRVITAYSGAAITNMATVAKLSAENTIQSGAKVVAAGTGCLQLNAGNCAINGNLETLAGATLKNMRDSDALNYGGTMTVDVSGTLDMGTTRWSLGSNNTIKLHDGAKVIGTGNATNGGWDWIESNTGNVIVDGDVSIATKLKLRGAAVFTITEGKTVTHTGGWTGTGTVTVNSGKFSSNALPSGNVVIEDGATFTLKDCNWVSGGAGKFSGLGTLELDAAGNQHWYYQSNNFAGVVKIIKSGSGLPTVGGNGSEAPVFTATPEMIFDGVICLNGCFHNNTLPVRDFSGNGEVNFVNSAEGTRTISTKQTKNTEYSGVFKRVSAGNSYCNSALKVYGEDDSEDIYSLTLSGANETSGPLMVTNNAKVVFTSGGSWANGAVTVGNDGWLQSTNATAVTKLTLTDGANIVLPTSSSTLTGITSLTFTSGNTWITFADGVPAVDTVLIDWTGASLESAPAGYFKFADSSLNATYYLEKSTTGLTLKAVVKIDDGAAHEVGYIDPNNGAATITNAVANVTVPVSSTGLLTVLNGTSVTYNYSGSNITDENKGGTVFAFATDENGQIIQGTPITSLCTVTVADGKITVALDESKVAPNPVTDDETNPPMAMTADSVVFALPMKAGLWYSIESGSSVDGSGNIVGGTLSTPQYSSSTSTQTLSIGFSGTVKYFKPAVAASKAALVTPPSAE